MKNIQSMSRAELQEARDATSDPAIIGRIDAELATRTAEERAAERRGQLLGAIQGGPVEPEPIEDEERYSAAFDKYLRFGERGLDASDRSALDAGYRTVPDEVRESRALTTTVGSSGGFTVPMDFLARIVEAQAAFGGLRNAGVGYITTETGRDLEVPTSDDTGNVGELISENVAATEQDVEFGQKVLKAWLWSSKLIRVPNTLIEDSAFSVQDFLGRTLGKRIGRAQAPYLITGTGSSQPEGLLTNVTTGHTTAGGQTTTFIYDDFVDMEDSLDSAYLPDAEWVISRSALTAIKKIKDTNGDPIYQRGLAGGEPNSILGYPVTIDVNMPAVAAVNKPVVFGDLSEFTIRDVIDFELIVLKERYAEFRQTGFLGWSRMDARPLSTDGYVALEMDAA